jgi:UDP-2,3-diacylglucosamine pyrophosphatase LpxH
MNAAIDQKHHATRIRALFLSDFHFGYRGVDGAALLDCLKTYSPQTIYLVGDIIDGWKLAKRWHWTADYTRIIDALVDHRRRGVKIIYLPGNHDERVRTVNPILRARFCFDVGLKISNTVVHKAKDGRKIVVLHGDQFDNALLRGRISKLGDWFIETLSDLFSFTPQAQTVDVDGKRGKFSLAKALMKKSGKAAFRMLGLLERRIVRLLRLKSMQGLICGHTHMPKMRMLRRRYMYGNCGMWMGYTNTAIIETMDGQFELVRWPDMRTQHAGIKASEAVHMARHYETALIIRRIRQLWPAREN